MCFSLISNKSWHKAIIGWALNIFARVMPGFSCLGDDNDGEDADGDVNDDEYDEYFDFSDDEYDDEYEDVNDDGDDDNVC